MSGCAGTTSICRGCSTGHIDATGSRWPPPPDHPLARHAQLNFDQTLAYEHVGLPPSTAVHTMLRRAAARAGKGLSYRVIVSNFDAAFRVVAAGLGISVVPVEVATTYQAVFGVKTIPLVDPWAERQFIVCFKHFEFLPPAAQRMVDHLVSRAAPVTHEPM